MDTAILPTETWAAAEPGDYYTYRASYATKVKILLIFILKEKVRFYVMLNKHKDSTTLLHFTVWYLFSSSGRVTFF